MMMGFGFGGLGIVLVLALWVLVIALAVWLLSNIFPRAMGSASPPATTGRGAQVESPLEVLNLRYARGEIDSEQYELMKRDIER